RSQRNLRIRHGQVENPSIFKTGRSHPNTPLPAPLAAAPYRASDLVRWDFADMAIALANVCFAPQSGHQSWGRARLLCAKGLNRSRDSVLRRAARAMGYWDVSVLS
ncbi:MAG TPA: hypothetical protein VF331_11595, partial [Polyangiales bacterium]